MKNPIKIVGMGGATRTASTSEKALRYFLAGLEKRGASIEAFVGADLDFAIYDPYAKLTDPRALRFIEAVRGCDALVIATPVYHGSVSGLVKNAIDYLTPLADDVRPYLTGRAVTCIAAGGGLPGAVGTLSALRYTVHALRGWPTPMHIPINSSAAPFNEAGTLLDAKLAKTFAAAEEDLWSFVSAMKSPAYAA
jgi:FMN reductase